jgi:hypothetical protein
MKIYSLEAIEKLISHYTKNGGSIETIKEGTLGYGTTVLKCEKLKFAVIKEVYLNEWSSGHTVRLYNKLPQKYQLA